MEDKSPKYYLEKAKELAYGYHDGQLDLAGNPYVEHPAAVAKIVAEQGYHEHVQAVAYMHDLLEDTNIAIEYLEEEFPHNIFNAVVAMTHLEHEPYVEYVIRLSGNSMAKIVKIADLTHNMSLDRVIFSFENKARDFKRIEKYINAYRYLTDGKIWSEDYRLTAKKHVIKKFTAGAYDEIDQWITSMEELGFELVSISSFDSGFLVSLKRKER